MKRRKTAVCLLLGICLLGGCTQTKTEEKKQKPQIQVAFVSDLKGISDGGYNQETWEGVQEACKKKNLTCASYTIQNAAQESYDQQVKKAADGGAGLIVLVGEDAQSAVARAQGTYGEVSFLLVDGTPKEENADAGAIGEKTACVNFSQEQRGFLAGYAAVKNGYRNLGFLAGEKNTKETSCASGFVQGAEYAASEDAVPQGEVIVNFRATGSTGFSPDNTAAAEQWFVNGCEIILGSDQQMNLSVIRAADAAQRKAIGSEIDQTGRSETVCASAINNMKQSVSQAVEKYANQSLSYGKEEVLGVSQEGVALTGSTWRFETFTQQAYEQIRQKLIAGEAAVTGEDVIENPALKKTDLVTVNVTE